MNRRRLSYVTALLALLSVLVAASDASAQYLKPSDVLGDKRFEPDFRITYGDGPRQFGELRIPAGARPHPVLIVIHGGCWMSFATPRIMEPFVHELTSAGFATWSLEYRPVDVPDGGWPNTFLDIADGIDHLRKIKEQYKLDLENVLVTGHSAGGHLALWAAGRHRIGPASVLYRRDPLPIAGVVSLAGVGDLEAARPLDNSVCGGDVIDDLAGGSPDEVPEHYAAGSPIQLLPLGVPQRLLTGKADESVPPWLGNAYATEARRAGDDVEAVTLDGSAHFEVIAPGSVVWDVVRRTILEMRKP